MNYLFRIFGIAVGFMLLVGGAAQSQTISEGETLVKNGKFKEAKTIFEEILKKDENNAEAHSSLGILYLIRSNPEFDVDEAVDETEKAVDLDPNNADYQYNYGAAIGIKTQNAGIIKQAILAPKVKKAFARAVQLNPKHVQARIGLAQYLMMAPSIMGGDEDEAWKHIDEVIKLDELLGRTIKARFLARAKKNDQAENEYKILIESKSKEWKVWHSYGYFCMRLERYDDAVNHFKKYIELRPDTADSYQSLAEALLKKGNVESAMTNLNKSLSIDKGYIPAIISLGEVYEAKGQKKEAKETYRRVISMKENEYYKKQAEKKLKEIE